MDKALTLEGKKYISAKLASEVTGYTSDYIGQLCRGKKINAKLVGRSWYVLEKELLDHKNSSKAVSAAVKNSKKLKSADLKQNIKSKSAVAATPSDTSKTEIIQPKNDQEKEPLERLKYSKSRIAELGSQNIIYSKDEKELFPEVAKNISIESLKHRAFSGLMGALDQSKKRQKFEKFIINTSIFVLALVFLGSFAFEKSNIAKLVKSSFLENLKNEMYSVYSFDALLLEKAFSGVKENLSSQQSIASVFSENSWSSFSGWIKNVAYQIIKPWTEGKNYILVDQSEKNKIENEKNENDTIAKNNTTVETQSRIIYTPAVPTSDREYVDFKIAELKNYFLFNPLAPNVNRYYLTKQNDVIVGRSGGAVSNITNTTSGASDVSELTGYDWTFADNYGAVNITPTSTVPIWAEAGINASSTSHFANASTTLLSISDGFWAPGLTACTSANKIVWSNGTFSCATDQTGGGSGGGSWSTTTSLVSGQLVNYPNNDTDVVAIGANATTSAKVYFDPNTQKYQIGNSLTASTTIMGNLFTNYSSSTIYSSFLTASTTNLIMNGQSFNNLLGSGLTNTGNALTVSGLTTSNLASANVSQFTNDAGYKTFSWPFDVNAWGNSTTTRIGFLGGLNASSTSIFDYASSTALTVTGNTYLAATGGRVGVGTLNPSSILSVVGSGSAADIIRWGPEFVDSSSIGGILGYSGSGQINVNLTARNADLNLGAGSATTALVIQKDTGLVGIGTTTPAWLLNPSSATASQLALSAGAGINQWAFRNAGGNLYLSTTTVAGTATSTLSALEIAGGGFGTTTVRGLNISGQATSTSNVGLNIAAGCYAINGTCLSGNGGSSASSTLLLDTNSWSGANTFVGLLSSGYSSSTIYSSFLTASTTNLIMNGQSFNNLLGSGLTNTGNALTVSGLTTSNLASANVSQFTNDAGYKTFSWPFTPTTWGVATSTTVGLLEGFLSTASSTINASTTISGALTATGGIYGSGLSNCNTGNFLTWTSGSFGCASDQVGTGGDNAFSWPFTPTTWGVATSTTLGLLEGFFSTASSTISGPFHLSSLSDGGLTVYGGLVSSAATTTAGTGLTYSANSFNVNTTQNIAKLSNLTSNGFVKTSGGDGTLSIDTNTYATFAWPFDVNAWGNSTTTRIGFLGGLNASSTSIFDNASTTRLSVGSDFITDFSTGLSISAGGVVTVTDVTCTDCLNETEIEDIYLLNTSDSFTGTLSGPYSSSTIYSSFLTASTTNLIMNGQSFNNLLGSGLTNTGNALTLDNTGAWTGTFDGQEGAYYLARANHTGTQGISTLSNYDWAFDTTYNVINITASTSMPIWAKGGLNASSTSHFNNASTTQLSVGSDYITDFSTGLSISAGGVVTVTDVTCTDCLNATEIEDIYLLNTGDTATGDYTFDTSTLFVDSANDRLGVGTTSPLWLLNSFSATAPQLALSAGAGVNQWTFRNAGGNLYLSTTTVDGTATTSTSALEIASGGFGTTTVRGLNIAGQATTTSNVGMNITTGCYAINGTCLSTGGGGGSGDITAVGSMTSGDAFADATADDDWLGLGATAGRIEFDDQTIDEVNILAARLGVATSTPNATLAIQGTAGQNIFSIATSTGTNVLTISEWGGIVQKVASSTALSIQMASGTPVFEVDTTTSNVNAGVDITAATGQTANLLNLYSSGGTFLSGFTAAGGLFMNISSSTALNIYDGSGNAAFVVSSTAGDVGIGTSTLAYDFTVQGNQSATYIARIDNANTGTDADGLLITLGVANASRTTSNYFIGFANGSQTVAGKIQGGASAVAYTTTAADLAEYFRASDISDLPKSGEVVMLDKGKEKAARRVEASDDPSLEEPLGVISTNPGFIGNGPICLATDNDCDENYAKYNVLVAIAGQVPVRISLENGPIAVGDYLTLSTTTPGAATKLIGSGYVIGMAISEATTTDFVSMNPNKTASSTSITTSVPTVMAFIKSGWRDVEVEGNDAGVWSNLFAYLKKVGLEIGSNFIKITNLVTNSLVADKVETKELCVDGVCVGKEQLQALLLNAGTSPSTPPTSSNTGTTTATTTPSTDTATSTPEIIPDNTASTTPPIIESGPEADEPAPLPEISELEAEAVTEVPVGPEPAPVSEN